METKKEPQALSIARVARLKAPARGQSFTWDSSLPGFGVRVTSTGAKSYVFQSKEKDGRSRRVTIGSCSAWDLLEARQRARELRQAVDKGQSPAIVQAQKKAAKERKGQTVARIWADYCKAAHKRSWGARHRRDMAYLSRPPKDDDKGGILWPLLAKHPAEIDSAALIAWVQAAKEAPHRGKINKGKHAALRQAFIAFRGCWNWASARPEKYPDLAPPTMFSRAEITTEIPKAAPKRDVLEASQLQAWFTAVQKISNRVIGAYLQALILTGARKNELLDLKWSEVDFTWKKLQLKDKVEAAGRDVPLTPYVEFLLSALPRRNKFVFSSASSKSGALVEARIAHKKALASAGIDRSLSLHGLRRSYASLSEEAELPAGIAAQCMGHKPSATAEKFYKVRSVDTLQKWVSQYEAWILAEAGIPFTPDATTKGGLHAVK